MFPHPSRGYFAGTLAFFENENQDMTHLIRGELA